MVICLSIDCQVDWLIDWLFDRLVDWLIGGVVDQSVDYLFHLRIWLIITISWLLRRIINWFGFCELIDWSINESSVWFIARLIFLLVGLFDSQLSCLFCSDITLESWLTQVVAGGTKGIKLDFKSIEVALAAVHILRNQQDKVYQATFSSFITVCTSFHDSLFLF